MMVVAVLIQPAREYMHVMSSLISNNTIDHNSKI